MSKLIRVLADAADVEKNKINFNADQIITIPCERCGTPGLIGKMAYAQVTVDSDEVEFVCIKCEGSKDIHELVMSSLARGTQMTISEHGIDIMLASLPEGITEDEVFDQIAAYMVQGISVRPGKHGKKLITRLLLLMDSVPEELRVESYWDVRGMAEQIKVNLEAEEG